MDTLHIEHCIDLIRTLCIQSPTYIKDTLHIKHYIIRTLCNKALNNKEYIQMIKHYMQSVLIIECCISKVLTCAARAAASGCARHVSQSAVGSTWTDVKSKASMDCTRGAKAGPPPLTAFLDFISRQR